MLLDLKCFYNNNFGSAVTCFWSLVILSGAGPGVLIFSDSTL